MFEIGIGMIIEISTPNAKTMKDERAEERKRGRAEEKAVKEQERRPEQQPLCGRGRGRGRDAGGAV
jgi:ubiquitin